MLVGISRNKLLINNNRLRRTIQKDKKVRSRCNHCGGLVRMDGELESCIMCSRVKEHICDHCSNKPIACDNISKKSA